MKSFGKILAVIFIFLGFHQTLCAQIGINQDNPSDSAVLHISSDSKGVLFPAPVESKIRTYNKDGLFYYSSDSKRFYYYNESKSNWQCLNPFNATDSSQITAPGDLVVNSDLTVNANLAVNGILEATNNNDKIELKKDINAKNNSLEVSDVTVNNNATVENGDVEVENGDVNVNSGKISGRGSVPIGTIVMWNGGTIPNGWEKCDGGSFNGVNIPNLTDRFIVAGNNSTSGGKIAYRDHKYTSEPNNCETERYTYYLQKPHPLPDHDPQTTIVDANSLSGAKSKASGSGWSKEDGVSPNPEDNDEYYINNPNCTVDQFNERETYKLIFIIRVE